MVLREVREDRDRDGEAQETPFQKPRRTRFKRVGLGALVLDVREHALKRQRIRGRQRRLRALAPEPTPHGPNRGRGDAEGVHHMRRPPTHRRLPVGAGDGDAGHAAAGVVVIRRGDGAHPFLEVSERHPHRGDLALGLVVVRFDDQCRGALREGIEDEGPPVRDGALHREEHVAGFDRDGGELQGPVRAAAQPPSDGVVRRGGVLFDQVGRGGIGQHGRTSGGGS